MGNIENLFDNKPATLYGLKQPIRWYLKSFFLTLNPSNRLFSVLAALPHSFLFMPIRKIQIRQMFTLSVRDISPKSGKSNSH
jgi:hypothetical protein